MKTAHGLIHFAFPPCVLVILVMVLSSCATTAHESKATSAVSQGLTDAAIERYILNHPEVIEQSLQALEAKREGELRERQKAALATKQEELLHDPASPVSGNLNGEITVVEFYDYRCGYCKRAAPAVTELQKVDPRVRVVYKDFPILVNRLNSRPRLRSHLKRKVNTKPSTRRCSHPTKI